MHKNSQRCLLIDFTIWNWKTVLTNFYLRKHGFIVPSPMLNKLLFHELVLPWDLCLLFLVVLKKQICRLVPAFLRQMLVR